MKPALSLLLILAACGTEPPPAPVAPATGPADPNAAAAPADAPPAGTAPADAPPPGEGGPQGPPTLAVTPGEGVLLSGTISYAGTLTRPIRLDFTQPNPTVENPNGIKVLHAALLDKAGPWSVEVPKGIGQVDIIAFIDGDNNGPSDNEPQASRAGVSVGETPVTDLDFALVDPPGYTPPEPQDPDQMGGKPGDAAPKDAPPAPATGDAPAAPTPPAAGG